jgi:hypothetical protein
MAKPDEAAMHQVRDILTRCADAIDGLKATCVLEPIQQRCRMRWQRAVAAREEARAWLARWEHP